MNFKLDHKGAEEILKSAGVAAEIHSLAGKVADNAGDAVWVDHYTTDRAAAAVTIPAARQAKHGTLTKAASAAGLEVHSGGSTESAHTAPRRSSARTTGHWTAEEIRGVFSGSVSEVAGRTGRSEGAVRAMRQKLGRG